MSDILVVDDEADIRAMIRGILEDEGMAVREAATVKDVFAQLGDRCPSLVLLDVWLDDSTMDGLTLLKKLKTCYESLPVIVISGHATFEMAVNATREGADDFIQKPFKTEELLLKIRRSLEAARLRHENQKLRSYLRDPIPLLGDSSAVQHLKATIQKLGPTNSRAVIIGEPGVGKEVVAREIHNCSKRKSAPFVVLNCATLDVEHFEEELFGIEGDDAIPLKMGALEQAHGGTLLLDEVTDFPLLTQGKILRVLQEQTFKRLGGSRLIQVDIRILATSQTDLKQAVDSGLLREDLYYRLNVVTLVVPPLRKRRQDIPILLDHFLSQSSSLFSLPSRLFTDELRVALQTYDWPGNIRELRNVVERLLIMAPSDMRVPLTPEHLPPEIVNLMPKTAESGRSEQVLSLPLKQAREMFERQYLLAQVTRFDGNISRTAHFVGMERSALHRKLRLLKVEKKEAS